MGTAHKCTLPSLQQWYVFHASFQDQSEYKLRCAVRFACLQALRSTVITYVYAWYLSSSHLVYWTPDETSSNTVQSLEIIIEVNKRTKKSPKMVLSQVIVIGDLIQSEFLSLASNFLGVGLPWYNTHELAGTQICTIQSWVSSKYFTQKEDQWVTEWNSGTWGVHSSAWHV